LSFCVISRDASRVPEERTRSNSELTPDELLALAIEVITNGFPTPNPERIGLQT